MASRAGPEAVESARAAGRVSRSPTARSRRTARRLHPKIPVTAVQVDEQSEERGRLQRRRGRGERGADDEPAGQPGGRRPSVERIVFAAEHGTWLAAEPTARRVRHEDRDPRERVRVTPSSIPDAGQSRVASSPIGPRRWRPSRRSRSGAPTGRSHGGATTSHASTRPRWSTSWPTTGFAVVCLGPGLPPQRMLELAEAFDRTHPEVTVGARRRSRRRRAGFERCGPASATSSCPRRRSTSSCPGRGASAGRPPSSAEPTSSGARPATPPARSPSCRRRAAAGKTTIATNLAVALAEHAAGLDGAR